MGASPSTPEVHNGDGGCFSVRCKSGPLEEYGKAVIRVGHDVRARALVAAGKRGCGFVATPPRILFHPPCPALSRARRTPRSPARGLWARARPRVRPGSARLRLVSQTQTTPLPCAHSRTAPQYVRVMRAVEEVYDTSADRAADTLLLLTFGEIAKANSSARELMLKVDNADGVVVRFRATLRPPLRARTPRACAREAQGPAAHWPRFTPRAPPPAALVQAAPRQQHGGRQRVRGCAHGVPEGAGRWGHAVRLQRLAPVAARSRAPLAARPPIPAQWRARGVGTPPGAALAGRVAALWRRRRCRRPLRRAALARRAAPGTLGRALLLRRRRPRRRGGRERQRRWRGGRSRVAAAARFPLDSPARPHRIAGRRRRRRVAGRRAVAVGPAARCGGQPRVASQRIHARPKRIRQRRRRRRPHALRHGCSPRLAAVQSSLRVAGGAAQCVGLGGGLRRRSSRLLRRRAVHHAGGTRAAPAAGAEVARGAV